MGLGLLADPNPISAPQVGNMTRNKFPGKIEAQQRQPEGKPLHMVVDSEWVLKGTTEWGVVWRRHNWQTSLGEVTHRDLWEPVLDMV